MYRLKDDEKGAAPVGETETTKVPTTYFHPEIKEIVLCDLPGVGSPEFPTLEKYCEKIDLEKYDVFLIVFESRFTIHDKQLIDKVSNELQKPFFVVRTKFEKEVENNFCDNQMTAEETKEEILKEFKKKVAGLVSENKKIYFIDNDSSDLYDFPNLKKSIANIIYMKYDGDEEFLIGLLKNDTIDVIKLKANLLRGMKSINKN